MRKRDTLDVLMAAAAVVADALVVFSGFMLATLVRFDSGWIPMVHDRPENLYGLYALGASAATLLFLGVFQALGLYKRPQTGSFPNKIPRLVRGVFFGELFTVVLAFAAKNVAEYSTLTLLISAGTILLPLLLQRWILFRIEWNLARHSPDFNRVLILGTDRVAARLEHTLKREAMLRSRVIGFLRTDVGEADAALTPDRILGTLGELRTVLETNPVQQIILADSRLPHERIVDIILLCERNLVTFNMVPDLFRILTSSMDVQSLDDIPLLGISPWPLDRFVNRMLKRIEDVLGALVGLVVAAPVIAVVAVLIKRASPGPVFYRQERCGERGRPFTIYKLRTMRTDAEAQSGPVFARAQDDRTTPIGAWLRQHNVDELPQLWNVLCGEMSLVGPRPERPHFVEKFKEDFHRYMWRHVSKPGMTGWAQVNGLRGNTSIEERIKYDLYYLENWSLAFDFKILLRTFVAHENAY